MGNQASWQFQEAPPAPGQLPEFPSLPAANAGFLPAPPAPHQIQPSQAAEAFPPAPASPMTAMGSAADVYAGKARAGMANGGALVSRDQFIIGKEIGLVYTLAATVAGIFVVKGIATFLQDVALSRAGNSIIAEQQRQLYDRILSQGLEFFHGFSSSDLITRLTQNAQAARNVVDLLVTSFFRDLFSLLGLVAVKRTAKG